MSVLSGGDGECTYNTNKPHAPTELTKQVRVPSRRILRQRVHQSLYGARSSAMTENAPVHFHPNTYHLPPYRHYGQATRS